MEQGTSSGNRLSGPSGRGNTAAAQERAIRRIITAGLLLAITLLLAFTPVGFIPVPTPAGSATIAHIPTIIGGVDAAQIEVATPSKESPVGVVAKHIHLTGPIAIVAARNEVKRASCSPMKKASLRDSR